MTRLPGRRLSGRVVEVMVAMTVASIVCLLAGPYLYRLWRRERLRIAAQELYTLVLAARLKAVKMDRQVVLWINPPERLISAWADEAPFNFVQDPGEPTILHLRPRQGTIFRAPGEDANGPEAVAFDKYHGDPKIVDRIVFHPDGTLLPPQSDNSKPPVKPAAYTAAVPYGSVNCPPGGSCRGVYLSDRPLPGAEETGNTFRVSVSDFGPDGPDLHTEVAAAVGGGQSRREQLRASPLEVGGLMQEYPPRRRYDRRTGVALLSGLAATNVIPWMELLLGETATAELLATSEVRLAAGTCVVALAFLLGAWFSGRRRPIPARPWIARPRLAGMRFSVAAAALNLALAGLIRWLGARRAGFPTELPLFVLGWYLVVLPLEVLAGFYLGRAGKMPGRRREPPS